MTIFDVASRETSYGVTKRYGIKAVLLQIVWNASHVRYTGLSQLLYKNFGAKRNECRAPFAQKLLNIGISWLNIGSKIAQNRDRSRHFVIEYWENLVFGITDQSKKLETK